MLNLAEPAARIFYRILGYSEKEIGEAYQKQNKREVTGW